MWATVLAGSFGIAGVLIGQLVGRRTEHKKWLREQRRSAYVEVLAVSEEHSFSGVLRGAVKVAMSIRDLFEDTDHSIDPDELAASVTDAFGLQPVHEEVTAVWRRTGAAQSAVMLVAPADVVEAAERLVDCTRDIASGTTGVADTRYEAWRSARGEFVRLARADLGIGGRSVPE